MIHFWDKWGEDRELCPLRIIGFAPEHGDFPKKHFRELVFGILFLGVPVKWGFLFPKNKVPILSYLGVFAFGKRVSVFGDFSKSSVTILGIS